MNQACDLCGDPFDEGHRTPRALGCSGGHLICTYCLSQLFHSTEYHCFFDHDKISLRNKTLDDFKVVSPVSQITNPCIHHPTLPAKAFCLEAQCRKNLCTGCTNAHEPSGHSLVEIRDIPNKKKEIIRFLRDQIREADDVKTQKEKLLKIEKSNVLALIEREFKVCREQLDAQEVIVKKKLDNFFKELMDKPLDSEFALNYQIDIWVTQSEKDLNKIEQSRQSDQSILYDLVTLKDSVKRNSIPNFIADLKEINKSYKAEIDKISIKFAGKLADFMKEKIVAGIEFPNLEKRHLKDEKKPSFQQNNKEYNQHQERQERGRNQESQQNREKSLKRKSSMKAQARYGNHQNQEESKSNGRGVRSDSTSDIQRNISNDIQRAIEDLPIELDTDKSPDFTLRAKRLLSNEDVIKLEKNFKRLSPDALRNVTEINFNCEYLHGDGTSALGKLLQNLTSITKLSLEFMKSEHMTLEDFDNIERSLTQLRRLENLQLNLSRWKVLNDKVVNKLANNISSFKNLESLTLNCSEAYKIGNDGIKEMLDCFKKLTKLRTLYVYLKNINNITNKTYEHMINFSEKMPYMTTISFDLFQCKAFTVPVENMQHNPKLSIKR